MALNTLSWKPSLSNGVLIRQTFLLLLFNVGGMASNWFSWKFPLSLGVLIRQTFLLLLFLADRPIAGRDKRGRFYGLCALRTELKLKSSLASTRDNVFLLLARYSQN